VLLHVHTEPHTTHHVETKEFMVETLPAHPVVSRAGGGGGGVGTSGETGVTETTSVHWWEGGEEGG
jgi:hypothetical protein